MKRSFFIGLICLLTSTISMAQQTTTSAVKKTILAFSTAGDNSNAEQLSQHLDDNYRVVMNRLFGSKEVSVLSKNIYLQKIKAGELGGDKRTVVFQEVIVNGSSASAKVTFKGSKLTFTSLITLIQDTKGNWKLVSDVPVVS